MNELQITDGISDDVIYFLDMLRIICYSLKNQMSIKTTHAMSQYGNLWRVYELFLIFSHLPLLPVDYAAMLDCIDYKRVPCRLLIS